MGTHGRANQKAERAADQWMRAIGATAAVLDERMVGLEEDTLAVTGINFRAPSVEKPDWLVVVKAVGPAGTKMVAFGGGSTFAEAMKSTLERLYNRSLKWREDQW
jgi:hypothetical protein